MTRKERMFKVYREFGYPENSNDFENEVDKVIKDELQDFALWSENNIPEILRNKKWMTLQNVESYLNSKQ